MGTVELSTERLRLRKPGPGDSDALIRQLGDLEVARWLSRVPHPYKQSDVDDWQTGGPQGELDFCIYRDASLIGGVGLTLEDDGYYELGYWVGREHWGNGYATEAARCLLDHARNVLGINRFKSAYMLGNDQSGKVLKKLGFRQAGEKEIFSIARGESVPGIRLLLATAATTT